MAVSDQAGAIAANKSAPGGVTWRRSSERAFRRDEDGRTNAYRSWPSGRVPQDCDEVTRAAGKNKQMPYKM